MQELASQEEPAIRSSECAQFGWQELGTYEVVVASAEVATFIAATNIASMPEARKTTIVPAAFPIIWLTLPAIKQSVLALTGKDCLPVHETQSFDYHTRLRCGEICQMRAAAQRQYTPDRLAIEAIVYSGAGELMLTMRCLLRLVSTGVLPSSATGPSDVS